MFFTVMNHFDRCDNHLILVQYFLKQTKNVFSKNKRNKEFCFLDRKYNEVVVYISLFLSFFAPVQHFEQNISLKIFFFFNVLDLFLAGLAIFEINVHVNMFSGLLVCVYIFVYFYRFLKLLGLRACQYN